MQFLPMSSMRRVFRGRSPERADARRWLLLVTTLPTEPAEGRMAALRTIENLGAARLRDGVFLLPDTTKHRASFERLIDYVHTLGGDAHSLTISSENRTQEMDFRRRVDRTALYQDLLKTLDAIETAIEWSEPSGLLQALQRQRDEFARVRTIDFLGSPQQMRVAAGLARLEQRANSRVFPGTNDGAHKVTSRKAYFRKIWATRQPLTTDRLASGWLIRRFVDPEAALIWLDKSDEAPKYAVTYGFEGANFANTRSRVTFEELLRSFGLEQDDALMRTARLIRSLATADTSTAQLATLQSMLDGTEMRARDTSERLAAAEKTFDWVYESRVETPLLMDRVETALPS